MNKNTGYCNQKFQILTIDAGRQETRACCTAQSSKIDISRLKLNPGSLFNTSLLIDERHQMLDDNPVSSCNICYDIEQTGLMSRRLAMNSVEKTHTNVISSPKEITLVLGIDCNMTCSYCCKENSTSWARDILNNGTYFENDTRNQLIPYDKLLLKLGQKALQKSSNYQLVLNEVTNYASAKIMLISGGEPFLYNGLISVVNKFENTIHINSGLGVNHNRFKNILKQLSRERIILNVSAENVGKFYEFNRHGNTFKNFLNNLNCAREMGFTIKFHSVISNLTIFGFKEFLDQFKDEICIQVCMDPDYLHPSIIDPTSKKIILDTDYGAHTTAIHDMLESESSDNQKNKCYNYIREFAQRRNLRLDIFPEHFLNWLQ